MAIKHAKVDVVTVGAGWTAAMLAREALPEGHDDGLARAGAGTAGRTRTSPTTTTASATRSATR